MKKCICLLLSLVLLLSGCGASEDSDAVLQTRRDTAEAHMRHMMSVLWQVDEDISYSTHVNSMGPEQDEADRVIHLEAGKLYSGMPYTHGSAGAETFLSFGKQDENGVYQMEGLTRELISGGGGTKPNNMARLSNDCADAVYWAWARIGDSFSFTMTQNMTASRGCLPVGSYTTEDNTYKKTKDIAKSNGEAVMYAAYACLQKADAVVTYNGSGHAMMVASVFVAEGNDPEESYVLVHEQFTSNYKNQVTYVDETTGQTVYCLGGVDRKYTFADLYKKGYLPVTIKELTDPAPVAKAEVTDSLKAWDAASVTAGTLTSMAKLASVTVTVTDAAGEVVQQAICFTKESEHIMFSMTSFEDADAAAVLQGSLDVKQLAAGTYNCKTQCLLGTGETVTVRDFDFEVK